MFPNIVFSVLCPQPPSHCFFSFVYFLLSFLPFFRFSLKICLLCGSVEQFRFTLKNFFAKINSKLQLLKSIKFTFSVIRHLKLLTILKLFCCSSFENGCSNLLSRSLFTGLQRSHGFIQERCFMIFFDLTN